MLKRTISFLLVVFVIVYSPDVYLAESHPTACDDAHPSQGVFFECVYSSDVSLEEVSLTPFSKVNGLTRYDGSVGVDYFDIRETGNGSKFHVTIGVNGSFGSDNKIALLLKNGYVALNKNEPSNDGKIKLINLTEKPYMWAVVKDGNTGIVKVDPKSVVDSPSSVPNPTDIVVESVCKRRNGEVKWSLYNTDYADFTNIEYVNNDSNERVYFDIGNREKITLITTFGRVSEFFYGNGRLFSYSSSISDCEIVDDGLYDICTRAYYSGGDELIFPVEDITIDSNVVIEESVYGRSYLINLKYGDSGKKVPKMKGVFE